MPYLKAPGDDPKAFVSRGDFGFNEDEALKNWLKGMTVSDDKNSARPVDVWFAMPDMEVRDQKFPFIVLELIGINEAKDREMRQLLKVVNDPNSSSVYQPGYARYASAALPFNLIYQATAYARHPRHHRQIIQQMLTQKVPGRLQALPVIPEQSKRHMELLSWTSRDTIEGGRKLWQTIYTILVATEISDTDVPIVPAPPVREVDIDTEDYEVLELGQQDL